MNMGILSLVYLLRTGLASFSPGKTASRLRPSGKRPHPWPLSHRMGEGKKIGGRWTQGRRAGEEKARQPWAIKVEPLWGSPEGAKTVRARPARRHDWNRDK